MPSIKFIPHAENDGATSERHENHEGNRGGHSPASRHYGVDDAVNPLLINEDHLDQTDGSVLSRRKHDSR